jgi:glycosyltransferase involved in cell wall biosynthesis
MGIPLKISDAVISDLYQVADVLLFPSREEGFGIPVLEAGLTRLPVFASDIPPIRESGLDWIYPFDPYGKPEIVATAIVDHIKKDCAYQLRKRVLEQFNWQSVWEKKLKPLLEEG